VRHLVGQAATESEHVALVGLSLGAVLGTSIALEPDSPIDAPVAISPAYHLSSWRLARRAPWLARAKRWIDRGVPDDYARHEAMPTRGVVETVRAMRHLRRRFARAGEVNVPWLLVQSLDDAVTAPDENIALHRARATTRARACRGSPTRRCTSRRTTPATDSPATTAIAASAHRGRPRRRRAASMHRATSSGTGSGTANRRPTRVPSPAARSARGSTL